ncbi:MAG: hypothetical protein ACREF9_19850, partial [Opitutaceae bacterium]
MLLFTVTRAEARAYYQSSLRDADVRKRALRRLAIITTTHGATLYDQRDLRPRPVNALDEDAFNVRGFRRAGAPDHISIIAERDYR